MYSLRKLRSPISAMNKQDGTIVLETMLTLPLFIVFVLAMIAIIKIGIAEIALDHALTETTKQFSAHMYAAEVLLEEFNKTKAGQTIAQYTAEIKAVSNQAQQTGQWFEQVSEMMPVDLLDLLPVVNEAEQALVAGGNDLYVATLNLLLNPLVMNYTDSFGHGKVLNKERLKIVGLQFPDLGNRNDPYFGIEATYDVHLNLPFIQRTIQLRKKSLERVWIGE